MRHTTAASTLNSSQILYEPFLPGSLDRNYGNLPTHVGFNFHSFEQKVNLAMRLLSEMAN